MGYSFYVYAWTKNEIEGRYYDIEVYGGQSVIKALIVMVKAKKTSGCVRLEWR